MRSVYEKRLKIKTTKRLGCGADGYTELVDEIFSRLRGGENSLKTYFSPARRWEERFSVKCSIYIRFSWTERVPTRKAYNMVASCVSARYCVAEEGTMNEGGRENYY